MPRGFQSQVGVLPAPAVEGDFASHNPRWNVMAGPGAFVAGPNGVTIGRFVWASAEYVDPNNAPGVLNNYGSGPPTGIVAREMQALITVYLQWTGMVIPPGFGVTCYSGCEIWVKNNGSSNALMYQKAYASLTDGSVSFAATGSAGSASMTGSSIAAATAIAGLASISGNVLNVTRLDAGTIYPGAILTGPAGVAPGTQIVYQLSGTPNGVGTYALNIPEQTVASGTLAATYGVLTVGGGGPPISGGVLSGTGVTTGTTVWQQLTATTWVVSPSQTAGSTTIAEATNVETKFFAMSGGAPGELIKITSHVLG